MRLIANMCAPVNDAVRFQPYGPAQNDFIADGRVRADVAIVAQLCARAHYRRGVNKHQVEE
jgi:hypothetical protein